MRLAVLLTVAALPSGESKEEARSPMTLRDWTESWDIAGVIRRAGLASVAPWKHNHPDWSLSPRRVS